jgi:hypothetical protein
MLSELSTDLHPTYVRNAGTVRSYAETMQDPKTLDDCSVCQANLLPKYRCNAKIPFSISG